MIPVGIGGKLGIDGKLGIEGKAGNEGKLRTDGILDLKLFIIPDILFFTLDKMTPFILFRFAIFGIGGNVGIVGKLGNEGKPGNVGIGGKLGNEGKPGNVGIVGKPGNVGIAGNLGIEIISFGKDTPILGIVKLGIDGIGILTSIDSIFLRIFPIEGTFIFSKPDILEESSFNIGLNTIGFISGIVGKLGNEGKPGNVGIVGKLGNGGKVGNVILFHRLIYKFP